MENASKALLIAGAILLVILIISLGLMVYNQAKDTVGGVNLNQQEIEAFNSKFASYEGGNVSASTVNALLQTAVSANQALAEEGSNDPGMNITVPSTADGYTGGSIGYASGSATASGMLRVAPGRTYNVTLLYSGGLVTGASISANS